MIVPARSRMTPDCRSAAHPCAPMPVVVGVPRSGTTLLRFMLDAHPALAIPPETGFLAHFGGSEDARRAGMDEFFRTVTSFPPEAPGWDDFGLEAEEYRRELQSLPAFSVSEGLRAFYRLYARKQNKPRYGDKTPQYCEHIPGIHKILPETRFIHIIRDGRDVALSLRRMWFAPGKDIRTLAAYWRRLVARAREEGPRTGAYTEVRYEQLVNSPHRTLEAVCAFLNLDFHPDMLLYPQRTRRRLEEHKTRRRRDGSIIVTHEQRLDQQRLTLQPLRASRISRWKNELTAWERTEFLRECGDVLEELGYEL